MNTGQKNTLGRVIYRGPRGGEYVLGPAGRKIRSFTRAPVAAAPAPVPVAAAGPGNTGHRNTLGRVIYRGPRGGEYVLGPGGRKIRSFTRAPAAAAAPVAAPPPPTAAETRTAARLAAKLARFMKLSNSTYISKNGYVYNSSARTMPLTFQQYNNAKVRAFNKDPTFLMKKAIPYISTGRPNEALKTKFKLKNSTVLRRGYTHNGRNTGVNKKLYFNKKGNLFYLTLNGRKHQANYNSTQYHFWLSQKELRRMKRQVAHANPNYPLSAIPPASPPPGARARRASPVLLENMMNQIYNGGRGRNINASRYTNAERNVLARRLSSSIDFFKRQRDAKKNEAARHRASLSNAISNAMKQTIRAQAAAANERVGYYNNAVRAYTRGLRAVKPLTGAVTPRARAMAATPNRYTPAPANVNVNAIYMPLNRPHLVVKTPGAGTIYLNPNTFTGFMKNAGRVTIAPANVRNWLRMARRNFPNEALFRHPLAAKNVTASHIRFSRA